MDSDESNHYAIGYEDGLAGRDFHPEFMGSREYGNGWRAGRAAGGWEVGQSAARP